ncbi:hypothetical protein ElyMa_001947800 [Elysia marginata]|uniref:Anaphase-promoting complex subunit 4 WD40 domain-containing protein n=1 Tax=Elysia marginata TaxID=1093978 RepID=A0AAV4EX15_9GAST|nr:hypothetical protein ElyMa_001947800 [Elysia marginata]
MPNKVENKKKTKCPLCNYNPCLFLSLSGTFPIHNLAWHPDGDAVLLIGKEQMCICFLTPTSDATVANNTSTINNTLTNATDTLDNPDKQTVTFESGIITATVKEAAERNSTGPVSCDVGKAES